MRKMKRLVWILELGLVLGGMGCGDDLGTPRPDAAGADGGKSQGDGGGSSEAGFSANDGGGRSEANPVEANPVNDSAGDQWIAADSGIVDAGGTVDVESVADVKIAVDIPSNFEVAGDTSLHPATLDTGSEDTASTLDAAGDHPSGVDGGIADLGSTPEVRLEVGIDSLGPIDGSGLSLAIPATGEQFNPPLPNANSLPPGVWYCDMGTVHWAQGDRGAAKCPVCGMNLVLKS